MRILEPEDLFVLYGVGLTIEQGGLLRLHEPDRGLSTIADVSGLPEATPPQPTRRG
jgi:hypothetical protein